MKTTIEISDALLAEAKRGARREGTTLRALIEDGLRARPRQRRQAGPFRLRRASFRGHGLQPGCASERWSEIRDAAHEGRGA